MATEDLFDIKARYNARLSLDPHFSEIFLVSAFFPAFFAHSSVNLSVEVAQPRNTGMPVEFLTLHI